MPIYEYRCESCGHDFEIIQKMSDPRLAECPECGKPNLTKLMSPAAFRLKGGGWYETDFKGGDKKKNVDTPDAAPTEKTTEKTPEKKTAESPAKKSDDKAGTTPPKKSGGTEAVAS